jgi:hypothetical protein
MKPQNLLLIPAPLNQLDGLPDQTLRIEQSQNLSAQIFQLPA